MIRVLLVLLVFLVGIAATNPLQKDAVTIFMIGDSTMASRPYKDGNPVKGWGQLLDLYFKDPVRVENHAMSGRSTKSFIDEGRWQIVKQRMDPGDYVIIQFGHNDQKKEDPSRYSSPEAYQVNLEKFIAESRELGVHPILATPIVRRRFDDQGQFFDTLGAYPEAARQTARKNRVPLLDLHLRTQELVADIYGEARSKILFLHIPSGEYPSLKEDMADDSHLSAIGAFRVCDMAIDEIRKKVPELGTFIRD